MSTSAEMLYIGLDVGSTTVKAVVLDEHRRILWKNYLRHNARQLEFVLQFLREIEAAFPGRSFKVYSTGNGGRSVAGLIGATQVQEVNAVTLAVERLHPRAGSVVELGGQDAKVIIWKTDREGNKSSISYMNDKCAGGTGATLDKIFSRVGLSGEQLGEMSARNRTIHHVAAKCGVFAETDVVGLMKAGVPAEEIAVSICTAVVKQNIEVLLHGNALPDDVLLLGGPHTYIGMFAEIWREQLPAIWQLHRHTPRSRPMDQLVYVPKDAQYFAAIGAVYFGLESSAHAPVSYAGTAAIEAFLSGDRASQVRIRENVRPGLVASDEERDAFIEKMRPPEFAPRLFPAGAEIPVWLGVDGGSTSSKIAAISEDGELLYRDYVLSRGNPIVDVIQMLEKMAAFERERDVRFRFLGAGVTGYASALLKTAFCLDVDVVETVAHMKSAVSLHGDVDVICDVGGQDIKVLFMKHGRVVDIRLNTQCSAGNGYFLQSMATQFGVPIEDYASRAFSVRQAPQFNCGCAVFMEQDKVNFQQLGWSEDEIMAGLALVLPLNIWNHVVQEPNLSRFGTRFLLQGGTQRNLAALKAQVDFIRSRVPGATVTCHRHADVAGAIGAAIEARETVVGATSTFLGLQGAAQVTFVTRNNADTMCRFCANRCARTFIEMEIPGHGTVRHISGYGCDKGQSLNNDEMKRISSAREAQLRAVPNLVHESNEAMWQLYPFVPVAPHPSRHHAFALRRNMVVGIPRLLNLFYYAPFYTTYLRALGVEQIVFSDPTSERLWSEGNKWGAIDPCFPAKVAPAHVHNLLTRKKVTHILFPMITHLESTVDQTLGNNACVIQMGTPEVVEAAFTRDRDLFTEGGVTFWKPLVRMDRRSEAKGNLFDYFETRLGITRDESDSAVEQGYAAMELYLRNISNRGAQVLNQLVDEDRIGILCIGHPYHHDPGLNHGILEAFQKRGFPVLSIESLPTTPEFLEPLFGGDLLAARDIRDVWRRNFNRNTNAKIFAARIAARHPNLAVVDLSSFKCGHDAPTYSYVDAIFDSSETPHFLFHDIDQNRPGATFNIRVESIVYFLRREELRLRKHVANRAIGREESL